MEEERGSPPSPSSEEEMEAKAESRPSNGNDYTEQVMSEVHLGCPPGLTGPYISHFTFADPREAEGTERRYNQLTKCDGTSICQTISLDEDGDLVLTRRNKHSSKICGVTIQHNITSSIPKVGLQVWRAELALADFVLHTIFTSSDFDGIVALELGAGTGLVGILLARAAKTVFITDHGDEVLDNCAKNINLNSETFDYNRSSIYVRELDWKKSWPPTASLDDLSRQERFLWTSSEVEEAQGASLLVAADVVYSDDLTDALFSTLERLMSHGCRKLLYLALEKRYNFSLNDLDVVANGYSHFRRYLRVEGEYEHLGNGYLPCFMGKRIDLAQIPQYVREYDRGNDVEIWQIEYISWEPLQ